MLGDPSKTVQRTAAWSVRQSYSRHPETSSAGLTAVLESKDDRTRWGATRVFAQHFAAIAHRPEFGAVLAKRVADPVTSVRMQAVKGLWQFWYWTTDTATRELIEDTLLAAMGQPQPAWVESNLEDAVYNLADENIRYLYNNWVALLPSADDRDRAVRGRLAVESRLATKFAAVLEKAPAPQKKRLLRALTEFPLRRGDIYDPEADITTPAPPRYNRIGNDIEQIAFFGESGARIARALSPLLDEPDAEMRRLAAEAALLVRDVRFGEVNRIAGPSSPEANGLSAKMERIPEAVEALRILKPPPPSAGAATGPAARATRRLDEAFFRGYVEPILTKRGRDGYACVHCHSTHTLFNGTFSTALNVVDQADPENSLILRQPTSSSETEGVAGSATLAHGGGIRFTKDSPEYASDPGMDQRRQGVERPARLLHADHDDREGTRNRRAAAATAACGWRRIWRRWRPDLRCHREQMAGLAVERDGARAIRRPRLQVLLDVETRRALLLTMVIVPLPCVLNASIVAGLNAAPWNCRRAAASQGSSRPSRSG